MAADKASGCKHMVEQLKLIQCPHCGETIDLAKDGPVWVDIGLLEPIKCVDMRSALSLVKSCKGRIVDEWTLVGERHGTC